MKVRKSYLLGLGIACCIFAVVGYFVWKDSQFLLYTNEAYGIEIKYPKKWELKDGEIEGAVVFLSPTEGELDVFQENVNVAIQPMGPRRMILNEYTALATNQLKAVFEDKITFETSEPAYLADRVGHKIVYRLETMYPVRIMHIYMFKNQKVYTFTYSAEEDHFDKYMGIVNTMLASFKVQ